LPLFSRSARAHTDTLVAGMTVEGAVLASVRLSAWAKTATVVAGMTVEGAALASVFLSAWAQPATVVAGTTGEGSGLVSLRFVSMGPASHCGDGHEN
jgi:hypothetical protein